MAKTCEVCGKKPVVGSMISHSHSVSRRRFLPNLKKVKVKTAGNVRQIVICMKCLKAGKTVA